VVQLSGRSGLWLALGASVSLVVFFYYGAAVLALVGALSVCVTGFFALAWALDPLLSFFSSSTSSSSAPMSSPFALRPYAAARSVPPHIAQTHTGVRRGCRMANGGLVAAAASVLVIFAWFVWQHWILNNGA
jgi:hypothetical protein